MYFMITLKLTILETIKLLKHKIMVKLHVDIIEDFNQLFINKLVELKK